VKLAVVPAARPTGARFSEPPVFRTCRSCGSESRAPGAGFTLIEVLVATLVFSLVLVTIYSTWLIIVRSTDGALRVTAEAQRARLAVRVVEQALNSAQLFQANAALYAFVADTSGQFSAVSFAANLPESFPGGGYFGAERMRRVTFLVEDGAAGSELRLYQNSILAPPDSDVSTIPIVLARDVSTFQLEFWDTRAGEYAAEWLQTNQLPQMVRLTLQFGGGNGRRSEPSEPIVRIARLPAQAVPAVISAGGGAPNQLAPPPPPPVQPPAGQ